MLTATRCIAASLALHASLVGLASSKAGMSPPPRAGQQPQVLEAAFSIEAAARGSAGAAAAAEEHPVHAAVPAGEFEPSGAPSPRSAARAAAKPVRARPAFAPPAATAAAAPAPAPEPSGTVEGAGAQELAAPGAPAPAAGTGSMASATAAGGGGVAPGAGASAAGSPRGNASPGASPRGPLLTRYIQGVRERVARHREYPYLARRANLEGTICLRVSLAASGEVLGVRPTCGTEHAPLLGAALKSVARAAPFPPLPPALGRELTLEVPIVFDLDSR